MYLRLNARQVCGLGLFYFQLSDLVYEENPEKALFDNVKIIDHRYLSRIFAKYTHILCVRIWLSKEVVDALSLEVFKTRLDETLGNLI